ncbi:MAG: hypothetical protein HW406_2513 [Candidatus Brocadiaceae bacterium]|nr:hypothetical protein [Candidatus Brocadiaceae bacterium]
MSFIVIPRPLPLWISSGTGFNLHETKKPKPTPTGMFPNLMHQFQALQFLLPISCKLTEVIS